MTPKEKAIELITKFINIDSLKDFEGMDKRIAINCALICVNEIIEANSEDWSHNDYWLEVKQELEKLNK